MIKDEELLFITTAIPTKWLDYSQNLMRKAFPNSKFIVFDGSKNWPYSWFHWLYELPKYNNYKYFIHFDEDFFLKSKEEVIKLLNKMEEENIDICGPSDGFNKMRGANAVALNSYFMIGNVQKVCSIDFKLNELNFQYDSITGWLNNFNLKFDDKYFQDFNYNHEKNGSSNFYFEQEPYYYFLWKLKENGLKFEYLYQNFDTDFSSTNPRINKDSEDIGIHMWYTRQWSDNTDVHGLTNIDRYTKVEEFIKDFLV